MTKVIASLYHGAVGLGYSRLLGKFLGNLVAGSLYGAVEEPAYDA